MLSHHIRKLIYCLLVIGFSASIAGSFDDFFTAIRNDNASSLAGLLERGFDPNTRDEKGQPGLTIAMFEHSQKAARLLLAQPAIDVDALNSAGESPLMVAALKGDLPAAQMLIDRRAKVNLPGWSPLHYAATGSEPRLVRLLLERGAEMNAVSPNGTTPLMMAAQYGSEDSVAVLLAAGADPNRRNQKDMRAVDFARLSGREPLVRRLEQVTAR